MAEREIEKWVTINGHHVPIYKDDGLQSKTAKNFNASVGDTGVKVYSDIPLEEKKQMVYDFYDKYGINVEISGTGYPPGDTLKCVLDSVGSQIDEYGKDAFVLESIKMRDDINFEEGTLAQMNKGGSLELNPEYFLKPKEELDNIMKECHEDSFLHPKGDASSIIIHELGHARWNKALMDMANAYGAKDDEFGAMYNLCLQDTFTGITDWDMEDRDGAYKALIVKINEFVNDMNNSDYMKKQWEGNPHFSISELINPERNYDDGISTYATKNIHEMMAEAWADYHYNGDNASFMSKQVIMEFLNVERRLYI